MRQGRHLVAQGVWHALPPPLPARAMDRNTLVASDTPVAPRPGSLCLSEAVGVGPLSGVECEMQQRGPQLFLTALCSFIRKKKSIHIFCTHLAALGFPVRLHPAGEAQPCISRLPQFPGAETQLLILYGAACGF